MSKFLSDLWELLVVMANVSPYTPASSIEDEDSFKDSPSRGSWDETSRYYVAPLSCHFDD